MCRMRAVIVVLLFLPLLGVAEDDAMIHNVPVGDYLLVGNGPDSDEPYTGKVRLYR